MSTEHNESMMSFAAMKRLAVTRWYWFLISVVACCGLAFAYIKIHKPSYAFSANILITRESGDVSAMIPDVGMFSGMLGIKNSVDDELLILKSHSLMSQVVKELGINRIHNERSGLFNLLKDFRYNDYAIDVNPVNPQMFDTLSTTIRFNVSVKADGNASVEAVVKRKTVGEASGKSLPLNVSTPYGDFSVTPTSDFPKGRNLTYDIRLTGYGTRAEDILELIKIENASKKSSILNISFKHPNQDYALDLINHLMDAYNRRGIADKKRKDSNNLDFMNSRIELMATDLTNLETDMQSYMDREGIVNLEADVKFQLEMKGVFESTLVEAETQAEVLKMLRDFLRDPENQYSLLPVTTAVDPTAVESYNELILKRIQLEQNARGDNKALTAVNEQIAAMRKSVLESVDKAYESARIGVAEIRSRKTGTDSKINRLPEQQRKLLQMMRDQMIKAKVFAYLVQQREQTAMQVANAVPKGTIVDEAYSGNEPMGMKPKILLLLAFIIGLCLPPAFWYVRAMFRGRFTSRAELQNRTDLLVVGEACRSAQSHVPAVSEQVPADEESELFRRFRTDLLFRLGVGKRILVTSVTQGEGATFVAVNLASSLAMLGKRTLLVDLNLRNPSVASTLSVAAAPGVTDAVASGSLAGSVQRVASERNLDVLVAGNAVNHPAEFLASSRLAEMLGEAAGKYDYIVMDAAPVDRYSDTLSLAALADVTLFVMRSEQSPLSELSLISRIEEEERLPGVMIVANDTPFVPTTDKD